MRSVYLIVSDCNNKSILVFDNGTYYSLPKCDVDKKDEYIYQLTNQHLEEVSGVAGRINVSYCINIANFNLINNLKLINIDQLDNVEFDKLSRDAISRIF